MKKQKKLGGRMAVIAVCAAMMVTAAVGVLRHLALRGAGGCGGRRFPHAGR